MPYIIRDKAGNVMGVCTNKPGPGNKLPNGDDEVHDFFEETPGQPGYNAGKVQEVTAFRAAQEAKRSAPRTVAQKLAAIGITPEELKAELAK